MPGLDEQSVLSPAGTQASTIQALAVDVEERQEAGDEANASSH